MLDGTGTARRRPLGHKHDTDPHRRSRPRSPRDRRCTTRRPDTSFATLVLAHGAGANQISPFMTGFATGLAAPGLRRPDLQLRLQRTRPQASRPAAGARGLLPGRAGTWLPPTPRSARCRCSSAASPWAAGWPRTSRPARTRANQVRPPGGRSCRGLVLLGYPLHPPGKPQQVRVAHLPGVTHPDAVRAGRQGRVRHAARTAGLRRRPVRRRAPCTRSPCAGHSFEVPKRAGISQDLLYAAIQDTIDRLDPARRLTRPPRASRAIARGCSTHLLTTSRVRSISDGYARLTVPPIRTSAASRSRRGAARK